MNKAMKRKLMTFLATFLLSMPIAALAQDVYFVNTEAFGVHKEYNSKLGCDVWVGSMGNFLCKDSEMKPMYEMDRYVYFTGTNNDPDNPKVSPFSGVQKEWDPKRGCYVWKSSTGDFLGTDKKSVQAEDKKRAKDAAKQQKKEQQADKKQQQKSDKQHQQKTEKKQQQHKQDPNEAVNKSKQMLITSDEQMREAEKALKEAKAEVAAAKAQGIDLSEYHVDEYIKQAEDAINEYKRTRNKMK
jgi:hypothetical protein